MSTQKKNKLVAIFGWKYEPEWLVDDLKENLKGWVDDFAIIDDRDKTDELWGHEGDYRLRGWEMARDMKADWAFWTSPDERWEKDAGKKIRPLIDHYKGEKIFEFYLKELYHSNWYRCDGIWNEKYRMRLFPILDDQIFRYQPIQVGGVPHGDYQVERVDVNIYHLKMIEKENRRVRTEVFKALDPSNRYQEIGYDYLDDERDATMMRIPKGREYYPAYTRKYVFQPPQELIDKTLKDRMGITYKSDEVVL